MKLFKRILRWVFPIAAALAVYLFVPLDFIKFAAHQLVVLAILLVALWCLVHFTGWLYGKDKDGKAKVEG